MATLEGMASADGTNAWTNIADGGIGMTPAGNINHSDEAQQTGVMTALAANDVVTIPVRC